MECLVFVGVFVCDDCAVCECCVLVDFECCDFGEYWSGYFVGGSVVVGDVDELVFVVEDFVGCFVVVY